MELLDHVVVLFLVLKVISVLFSIVAAPIYIPTNSIWILTGTWLPTGCVALALFFTSLKLGVLNIENRCRRGEGSQEAACS